MKTTNNKMSTMWFLGIAFAIALAACGRKDNGGDGGGARGGFVPPGGGIGVGPGGLPAGIAMTSGIGIINDGFLIADVIVEFIQPGTTQQIPGQPAPTSGPSDIRVYMRVTKADPYCPQLPVGPIYMPASPGSGNLSTTEDFNGTASLGTPFGLATIQLQGYLANSLNNSGGFQAFAGQFPVIPWTMYAQMQISVCPGIVYTIKRI